MRVNIPDCAAATAHELLCNVGVEQQVAAKTGVFQQTDEPTAKLMKGTMVEIILVLMAISSGISLLIVSPPDLQRRAILAWIESEEWNSREPMAVARTDMPRQTL